MKIPVVIRMIIYREVPERLCGIPEVKKFQAVLPGYQIKVLTFDAPHQVIFCGDTNPTKFMSMIKEGDHYHGCWSYGAFMLKSYFCQNCNRGYDHDDFEHHPCEGRWCHLCERKECPDFPKKPTCPRVNIVPLKNVAIDATATSTEMIATIIISYLLISLCDIKTCNICCKVHVSASRQKDGKAP